MTILIEPGDLINVNITSTPVNVTVVPPPDLNVTITATPVEVLIDATPVEVVIAGVGVGPAGPAGAAGAAGATGPAGPAGPAGSGGAGTPEVFVQTTPPTQGATPWVWYETTALGDLTGNEYLWRP